jgi:bleomycin hydrolase
MSSKNGALSLRTIEGMRKRVEEQASLRVAMNAATQGNLEEIALNRRVVGHLDWSFSHEVPVGGITSQNQAGTCWLYAGLNWMRKRAMKKMKVEKFEFSQNYLVFWDRLEKANQFLERILTHRDRPTEDRRVHHLLKKPVPDGGEWIRLSQLVEKYGLVPRSAMANTSNLEASDFPNKVLFYKMREGAARLRKLHREGKKLTELRAVKRELLEMVYRMLVVLYGEPPRKFDYGFRTKKGKFKRDQGITPQEFSRKWLDVDFRDYVHLVSSPLETTPYGHPYQFEFAPDLIGASPRSSLNVPIDVVRDLAQKLLKKKKPVFFDCDVTQGLNRKLGLLDTELYDYGLLLGTDFQWDRAGRMEYYQQCPTHCMVLVGVDLVDGSPTKWKIENSWSKDSGHEGIFQMSDRWFSEYVYGIAVHRKLLDKKLLKCLEKDPIVLPPWHTLA